MLRRPQGSVRHRNNLIPRTAAIRDNGPLLQLASDKNAHRDLRRLFTILAVVLILYAYHVTNSNRTIVDCNTIVITPRRHPALTIPSPSRLPTTSPADHPLSHTLHPVPHQTTPSHDTPRHQLSHSFQSHRQEVLLCIKESLRAKLCVTTQRSGCCLGKRGPVVHTCIVCT